MFSCDKEIISKPQSEAFRDNDVFIRSVYTTSNLFQTATVGTGARLDFVMKKPISINSEEYYVLDLESFPSNENPFVEHDYGYVRTDSDANKVYWLEDVNSQEVELFDFNLEIGQH